MAYGPLLCIGGGNAPRTLAVLPKAIPFRGCYGGDSSSSSSSSSGLFLHHCYSLRSAGRPVELPTTGRCAVRRGTRIALGLCPAQKKDEALGQQSAEEEGTQVVGRALQAALWSAEAAYVLWLFLLPYAPGDPVWAISQSTVNDLAGLSLNFFFSLPVLNSALRKMKPRFQDLGENNVRSACTSNSLPRGRERFIVFSALPETAVSVIVAAVAVGASATLLRRMTEASSKQDSPTEMCKDCGGSGLCTVCNGEGFILKELSEEKAEKARLTAKNMATRYTAALPKKWSYCYKCSSTRSCRTCGGSGQVPI